MPLSLVDAGQAGKPLRHGIVQLFQEPHPAKVARPPSETMQRLVHDTKKAPPAAVAAPEFWAAYQARADTAGVLPPPPPSRAAPPTAAAALARALALDASRTTTTTTAAGPGLRSAAASTNEAAFTAPPAPTPAPAPAPARPAAEPTSLSSSFGLNAFRALSSGTLGSSKPTPAPQPTTAADSPAPPLPPAPVPIGPTAASATGVVGSASASAVSSSSIVARPVVVSRTGAGPGSNAVSASGAPASGAGSTAGSAAAVAGGASSGTLSVQPGAPIRIGSGVDDVGRRLEAFEQLALFVRRYRTVLTAAARTVVTYPDRPRSNPAARLASAASGMAGSASGGDWFARARADDVAAVGRLMLQLFLETISGDQGRFPNWMSYGRTDTRLPHTVSGTAAVVQTITAVLALPDAERRHALAQLCRKVGRPWGLPPIVDPD